MPNRIVISSIAFACAMTALAAQSPQPPAPAGSGQAGSQPGASATAPAQPSPSPPQEMPPVTFRVQIDYVEVDAVVTDEQGNPVRDLKREDFQVLEDGVQQKIELFTHIDMPVTKPEQPLFSPTPIPADVETNSRFDGRMYVIALDPNHTNSMRTNLVRKAARQFIERYIGANDVAAVVYLSGAATSGQDFTSNKQLLLAAVDKFIGNKLRSSTLTRIDEYYRTRDMPTTGTTQRIADPDDQQRGYFARTSLENLRNVARFMEGVRGRRKAIVLFSEGIDYDITDVFNNQEATTVMDATRDAIGAAMRANVSFYAIDPRGLTTLADEAIEQAGPTPDDPGYGISYTGLQDEVRLSQDSLRVLADETGGYAAVNSNDFSGAYARIVQDNSSYYVLGYYPTNDKRDGRFRKIQVRVTRAGLQVHARKGYVAPRGKVDTKKLEGVGTGSAELREALNSPVPESGLAMAVAAAAFKGPAPKASVLVTTQVDGSRFKFTEKDGQFLDTLELSLMAIDPQGKIQGGQHQNAEMKLRPQTRMAVERTGFRMLERLELAPGRYQLRVAARSVNTDAIGSVHYDLEVPDFSKEPFSLSGLVITSAMAALTPTARPDEQLKDVLKTPPTVARDFSVADALSVFAEVYDNQASQPHKVDITTTLRAEDGRVVFKTNEQRASDELQGARGGFGYVAQVPLKDVNPGLYVLRVEALSTLASSAPINREVLVRVWPLPQQQAAARNQAAEAEAAAKAVVPVSKGPRSGVEQFTTVVARNEEEWQAVWKRAGVARPAPKVNFQNTMIAAVFLGSRPTSGYKVDIVGVVKDGDTLVVRYAETQPAQGVASAEVITTPYAVAGIPMYAGEIRFEKVQGPQP